MHRNFGLGPFSGFFQVQYLVQREMPHFAGFCRGGRKRKVPKIADFQNFSSFCFRYEWSHLEL